MASTSTSSRVVRFRVWNTSSLVILTAAYSCIVHCKTLDTTHSAGTGQGKQLTTVDHGGPWLVGRREVVMIDVLHVTNAFRPVRRKCSMHPDSVLQ
jgi:hypothetical protein